MLTACPKCMRLMRSDDPSRFALDCDACRPASAFQAVTVVDWISYEESESKHESIGGMGGWVDGQGWPEFIADIADTHRPYYEALRSAIVANRVKCGGDAHQDSMVPVFSDGTVGSFSYRGWGDLLAAIWNTEDGGSRSYMSFYMNCTRGPEDV
jgi:hypothetical protein